jgi:hypothetical protein
MTTIQYVTAAGLSLLMLFTLANFVVFLYARGVVRAALDEGVRAGARARSGTAVCEARGRDVLDDLLRGPLGSGTQIRCEQSSADTITATADVTLLSWVPGIVPDWSFSLESQARVEQRR